MKSIAIFILFVGVVLVIKSYYEFKYSNIEKPKEIIKYIPISQYEETLSDSEKLSEFYKGMFELTQPNIYDAKKI
jgi:hypothetical protein